jgi:hypothetical protein
MFVLTTPEQISPQICVFCEEIVPGQSPVLVPVRPDLDADHGECFLNVKQHQTAEGGGFQLGWVIWESPGLYLEAEFHAVWADPNGELVDITPKADGETEVLYLPDPNATYSFEDDILPRNRRFALVDHPDLQEFFRLCVQRDEIVAKFDRQVPMSEIADIEMAKIQIAHRLNQQLGLPGGEDFMSDPMGSFLDQVLPGREPVETFRREAPKIGRNDPCPCGSGKKFKKCCG